MTWTEWVYENCFHEEKRKRESPFYKGQKRHLLTIKERGKDSFCILFDKTDICWFDSLEEAKSFWLWFVKWFWHCKEEMLREINTYFNL
jgi:hypothetical protein